ncbi:caprin like protein [Ditylenchus destructor]|uniref:Caprin like protein n=1 Tax=Ditylenchus destructor TaxID=166010 RepID=A0AAD4NC54_9BILA|nr:caprin like protein [Ditylenchus destructor]
MKGPIAATVVDSAPNGKTMKREANAKNGEEAFEILSQPTLKVEIALEKKLRNLEKRRQKLNLIRADQDNGAKLTAEQSEAISKLDEVVQQIDFIKDLQKLVNQQSRQYQRALRQRDTVNEEKNLANQREVAFSIVRYQEALKVLSAETNKLESAFPDISSDDVQAVQKFVNSLASNDAFDSTTDWKNHVNTLNSKLYVVTISSDALIDDNLSGLKLKSIIDQMMESSGFQALIAKKFDDGIADGEETETDESSLNDFQRESAGSSQKMMESNQPNDTNSPSPVSEISNQPIVSQEITNVITAEIKADDTTSGNAQKEAEVQNNLVLLNGDNNANDFVNSANAEAISPDIAVKSVDEIVETAKQESVSVELAPPADDTKKQDISTEADSQSKKNDKPFRRSNYVKKDRAYSNSNQQNDANGARQDGRFRRDFQNRGPRKFNNYNNAEKGVAPRANPPTVANGEAPSANNGNSRPYKRYSHGEQDNNSGRNAVGFHRRSMEPNNGAYPRRYHSDHQNATQQQSRPQNGSSNSAGFPEYEKRPPRIRQPYECGFRFAC